jgi:hypothetical protein
VVFVLAFAALATFLAGVAHATDPFPITETFTHATFGSPEWHSGGTAELTAGLEGEANGWLRLTKAEESKFGYVFYNEAFPSTDGALVEFEYADWGGTGADGLTFFLYNGSVSESEFHAGYSGGSLGYASCKIGATEHEGLSKGYIGVGFDEYGNYTNLGSICGLDGTTAHPNYVSVRGSEEEKYKLLENASHATTESLKAERSGARHVTVSITPDDELSVYIRYPDGTEQTVVESLQLPKEHLPATLKFGFVASTGGSTDNHEIRDTKAAKPTELEASVSKTAGGHERGEELTWTAVVHNEGPNPTQGERVSTSTGSQSLSSVTWTCTGTENASHEKAECSQSSGTGLPSGIAAGAMPIGTNLEYHITGTPTPTTSFAQMTLETEPTGDTAEMNPEKEKATATNDLTPLFTSEPHFTLAADGEAKATAGTVIGGDVTNTYHWQICEATGSNCVNIAGATGLTYQTTTAERGHTIRFEQIATNSATETTANTPAYAPLPSTQITESPVTHSSSRTATLKFTTETAEATFECSLDGGAWSACTSPKVYTGLSEGRHTFSVRAVYGGLSEPVPPSVEWYVEATAPGPPTITPGHSSPSPNSHESFTFGSLVGGDTLECRLDEGAWKECSSPEEFTGLSDGSHKLEARQHNPAGVQSTVATYSWLVETAVPTAPTITPAHSSPSPNVNERFTFGALIGGDTLECRLDEGAWNTCSAHEEFTSLAEGAHKVQARQQSKAGIDSPTASYSWIVEAAVPPAPAITSAPSVLSALSNPTFTFGNVVHPDTLECNVDDHGWSACSETSEFPGLENGPHTIAVRQVSPAGVGSEETTYDWTIDTSVPSAPTIVSAPASPSNVSNPVFVLGTHEEGDHFECRIDGGEWRTCSASTEFTGLANGEHTFEARQVSVAGVDSGPVAYTWTVDTTPPPAPVPVLTPEAETTLRGGHFEFTHEPGMVLECSIDGGPYHECTLGLSVTELGEGWHTVSVRQINQAGTVSPVTTYRWDVVSKPVVKARASKLTARLGARAVVSDDRSIGVGCLLDGGWLRTCSVRAYHYIAGHWWEVGTGELTLTKDGARAGMVHVMLNRLGRELLSSRLGGLGVTLRTHGETFGAQHLDANQLHVRLYPQESLVIPIVWPFETARSQLVGQAWWIVQGAAREVQHARRVTCIGYTDDTGDWAYNIGLGQRRAATVCKALRELGVRASLRLETRGEGRPRATNNTAVGRALNRRVELRVSY